MFFDDIELYDFNSDQVLLLAYMDGRQEYDEETDVRSISQPASSFSI